MNMIVALVGTALLGLASWSAAQTSPSPVPIGTQANATAMVDGEVRKIDREQGKITLKHAPIANLEMPGMTMVFRVQDRSMLEKVKEGDKVRFSADKVGGNITVTSIEAVK